MLVKVVIVDGFSNHDWKHTTTCIKPILESQNGFDIQGSTVPANPEEWTVDYKKGRVYNSTFGHVWKNQDEPLPASFPGRDAAPLSSYPLKK